MLRHVLIGIPCLQTGGTEMQTLTLARAVLGAGYNVTVCCYFEYEDDMVSAFRAAGADVLTLNLSRGIRPWQLVRRLRRAFRDLHPDIVHVQYMAPGLLPILAARSAGLRRIVATVHQPGRPYGWKPRLLVRLASRLCRKFICVSQSVEKSWFGSSALFDLNDAGIRGRRHCSIYNAVDIERIDRILSATDPQQLRRNLGFDGVPLVGTVGRLSHVKGIDLLVTAFAAVRQAVPDCKLLLVGAGPEQAPLMALADRLGVSSAVAWLGRRPWDEAMQLLSLMDVVIVPSRFEGFGLTAVEAMACRKPLVATDVDGLREVVDAPATGILVPGEKHADMAEAVVRLLANAETRTRMGCLGRRRLERLFSYPTFVEQHLAAYRL
jgi:glycosyltransferase involved in cell wall biosynthesis